MNQFDPFRAQKDSTFGQSLEAMCLVANHLIKKLEETDKVKENFLMLLKVCVIFSLNQIIYETLLN